MYDGITQHCIPRDLGTDIGGLPKGRQSRRSIVLAIFLNYLFSPFILISRLFDFFFRPPRKSREAQYIAPTNLHHQGWHKYHHPPGWIRSALLKAPDYQPQQGIHYYPYCRGRHYEYVYNGMDIYSRRRQRHH
jgi:hypothetical protein